MNKFEIHEVVYPEPHPKTRFRAVELVSTIDGARSRLTGLCGPSIEAVKAMIVKGTTEGNSEE